MSSLVPDIRHFDIKLWMSLRAIQPRIIDNVGDLFFPAKGGIQTTSTPFIDTGRSSDFLLDLTDDEYREVHCRANSSGALQFNLMRLVMSVMTLFRTSCVLSIIRTTTVSLWRALRLRWILWKADRHLVITLK